MKSYFFVSGLCACAAAVLVACGGGGGGGDGGNQLVSEAQAKQLAARTVGAVFAATDAVSQVMANNLGAAGDAQPLFGEQSANCAVGSGGYNLVDGDESGTLSTGDQARYSLSGCKALATSPWLYNGNAVLTVSQAPGAPDATDASSTQGTARRLGVRLSADVLELGAQARFVGEMALRTMESAPYTEVGFTDATITLAGVPVSFEGVRLVNGHQVTELSGTVRTQIDQFDTIAATLQLVSPLTLQSGAVWGAPSSGAVRVVTPQFEMLVNYLGAGRVELTVTMPDTDLAPQVVQTTQAELDELLGAPRVSTATGLAADCTADGVNAACVVDSSASARADHLVPIHKHPLPVSQSLQTLLRRAQAQALSAR